MFLSDVLGARPIFVRLLTEAWEALEARSYFTPIVVPPRSGTPPVWLPVQQLGAQVLDPFCPCMVPYNPNMLLTYEGDATASKSPRSDGRQSATAPSLPAT